MDYDQNDGKYEIPEEFNRTYIIPNNYVVPTSLKFEMAPSNPSNEYDNKTKQVFFVINHGNLLDPYSLYLNLEIENKGALPIQLDGSAHSLISSITVYANGKEIEKINSYDLIQYLKFDTELTPEERKKRVKNEGFGTNEYGTNEAIIYPAEKDNKFYDLYKNAAINNLGFHTLKNNQQIDGDYQTTLNNGLQNLNLLDGSNNVVHKPDDLFKGDNPANMVFKDIRKSDGSDLFVEMGKVITNKNKILELLAEKKPNINKEHFLDAITTKNRQCC